MSGRVRRRNLLVVVAGWALWGPVMSMAAPYSQLYAGELGASPFIISVISTVRSATLSVSRMLGGYLSDRYGRRKILWVGTLIVSFGYLLYAVAPSWEFLVVAAFVSGLSLFYQPALQSVVADSTTPEVRGRVYGVLSFIPGLLGSLSPLAGAYVVGVYGLVGGMRLIYVLSFAAGLVTAFMRWRWIEETLARPEEYGLVEAFREALRYVRERILLFVALEVSLSAALGFGFLSSYYSAYFLGISEAELGILFSASSLSRLATSLPAGVLVDKVGRRPVLLSSAVLLMVGSAVYALVPEKTSATFTVVLVGAVVGAVGGALYGNVIQTLRADLVPLEKRGRVYAAILSLIDLAYIPSTMAAGLLYENLGPRTPFMLEAALLAAVIPLILVAVPQSFIRSFKWD